MILQSANRIKPLLGLLLFVLFALGYQYFKRKQVSADGVFVKGTIVNVEGRKNGIMITLRYKFQKKFFEVRLGGQLSRQDIGKQFFVQVLPPNPGDILFFEDKPVPECLRM